MTETGPDDPAAADDAAAAYDRAAAVEGAPGDETAAPRTAIVVGAGITGVSAAEWLRRDGWRVTLLDRARPGDRSAASFGNAGLLARASVVPVPGPGLLAKAPGMLLDPDQPLYLRWSYLPRLMPFLVRYLRAGREDRVRATAAALGPLLGDAVDQHRALAEGTGAEQFIRSCDYGFLYRDRAAFEKDGFGHALRREHGHVPREIGREEIAALDPSLSPDWKFAAMFPDHGWIEDPSAYVSALAAHFMQEGGTVRRGEVAAITPDGKVVLKGGATMRAERVIVAAGAWSRRLAGTLGVKIMMETERGYHLMLEGASHSPPQPWMVVEAKTVATPMRRGVRFAGIVEFGGLEAGPSAAPTALQRKVVKRIYPDMTWESESVWMGHRPVTADSLPVLGRLPGAPSVILATGGQHVGLTAGPRLGRLAAQLAADRTPNEDLRPFAPDRF